MSIGKGAPDGGQGGKRGHSNMDHSDYNEAIKAASRKRRRLQAKVEIARAVAESETNTDETEAAKESSDAIDSRKIC